MLNNAKLMNGKLMMINAIAMRNVNEVYFMVWLGLVFLSACNECRSDAGNPHETVQNILQDSGPQRRLDSSIVSRPIEC